MAYTVYCHTFPNGKRYIGITNQEPERRWRSGKGYIGQVVYDAILKYGWSNIKHDILFTGLSKEEAEKKEIELIKALETDSHKRGYNVESGGNTARLSEDTKDKLRKIKQEYFKTHKHWNTGNHWSEETKRKISESHKGKKMIEAQKEKHRIRFTGSNNPMYNVKMDPAHKVKLQEACIKAKSKKCICIETREVFSSMAEASRKTGINSRTIGYVCNKDPKYKTAGGYHWKYYEEVIV